MAQAQQRYKVQDRIAAGGMAEVYRAVSAGLEGFKKTVAIKRVLPHLSEKTQFINMFLDEARLCARLNHSNCVQVFDIGVGDGTYFIVMEFVDGADLKGVIEHHKKAGKLIPVEEAVLMCVRICEGLAYAHELLDDKGTPLHIVHRDMSPPNVLITRYGEVKIVDFGLAKASSQLEKSEPGIIKGKFSYLSPEAAMGQDVDGRTDIFAVGIILWEMLAGRRLFLGDTDLQTVRQVQKAVVPSLTDLNPAVSAELDAVVRKALARRPEDRWLTAREFGQELNRALFHQPRSVSSFDIAALVEPVRARRLADKKQREGTSLIASLIDQALFEFTSLKGEGGDGEASPGEGARTSAPLTADSFAAHAWGSIGGREASTGAGADDEAFNLADQLEDGFAPSAPLAEDDSQLSDVRKPDAAPGPAEAPPAPASGSGGATLWIVLVVLAVGGAAAVAYTQGLIPGL